jgi:hypothetical protein
MQSEWAEVEVELLPPSEHYKREFPNSGGNKEDRDWSTIYNDIGFCPDGTDQFPAVITNVFRILVDQQPAGEGEFTLATRATNEFYEFCDYRGGNMAEVGALFFDHQGRAKTKSMQKALRKSDDRYFLFLESFQLHQDYRQHTWVGAKALQSFLTQSVVAEEWAVALFTPSSQSQFVGDDEQKYAAYQESIESGQRDDAWQQHMQDLLYLDMRQFIRAGFQKVTDVEHLTDEHYLFAVPSFLPEDTLPITHSETLSLPIVTKMRHGCPDPVGVDAALRDRVGRAGFVNEYVQYCLNQLPSDKERLRHGLLRFVIRTLAGERAEESNRAVDATRRQPSATGDQVAFRVMNEDLISLKEYLQEAPMTPPEISLAEAIIRSDPRIQSVFERDLATKIEKYDEVVASLSSIEGDVWVEVTDLVNRQNANIANSTSLHLCAENDYMRELEFLVTLFPSDDERVKALNTKNKLGLTPLMLVAGNEEYKYNTADQQYNMVKRLIELGADKDLIAPDGKTAFGKFQSSRTRMWKIPSETSEDEACFRHCEELLRPTGGPTEADDELLDENFEEEEFDDSDDGDGMDDDEDTDDYEDDE